MISWRSRFVSLRLGNAAPAKEMLQQWRAVGNIVSKSTSLGVEPQASHSKDKRNNRSNK